MKKVLKLLVAVVCILAMVASFAGCGNNAADNADKAVLKIGTNAEFPPFEFIDSEKGVIGEYAGIDMEIMKAVCANAGKEPVIENMDFDGLLMALLQGKVDCVISGMTITEERLKEVDFSIPYFRTTQVMIVKKDSDIKTALDMEGKAIGVVEGYTGQIVVRDTLGFESQAFKTGTDAIMELSNGKLDAVVLDSTTADEFIKGKEDLVAIEDIDNFGVEDYGIAIPKGNTELLEQVNATIEQMLNDGSLDKICEEFGVANIA